jgi:hypothetical protein
VYKSLLCQAPYELTHILILLKIVNFETLTGLKITFSNDVFTRQKQLSGLRGDIEISGSHSMQALALTSLDLKDIGELRYLKVIVCQEILLGVLRNKVGMNRDS